MISGKQIRAARALLDLSQDTLAEAAGLTPQAIRKIEDGRVQPRMGTISDIENVFMRHGVEFMDFEGVRLRDDTIVTLEGKQCFMRLLDDVAHTLSGNNDGELLALCVEDALSPPEIIENIKRLRRQGIKMRFIVKQGDNFLYAPLREYRWLREDYFHNNPTIIYGDKVAIFIVHPSTSRTVQRVVIIRNKEFAEAQRNLFGFVWVSCPMPKNTTATFQYDEE